MSPLPPGEGRFLNSLEMGWQACLLASDCNAESLKMQYFFRNWKLVLGVWAVIMLVGIALAQPSARAQNSSVAGWPDRDDEYKPEEPQKVSYVPDDALRTGEFKSDEDEEKFAEFYRKSEFPKITNKTDREKVKKNDPQRRDDLITKLRSDLARCEAPAIKDGKTQVFDKLGGLIVAYMSKVAKSEQYHPAARMNAVLAIGEVNSPKAVAALLATLKDQKQFDAIRVAALTGLIHLAGRTSMSDSNVAGPVIVLMAKIAGSPIPKDQRADGFRWMHGQAADVLAALKSTVPQEEVAPALLHMLNDKDIPVPLRSKAAKALGKVVKHGDDLPAAASYVQALAGLFGDAQSPDLPADRARLRLVANDVKEGLQPFNSPDAHELSQALQKALLAFLKETETPLKPEETKAAFDKAKAAVDSLLKK